VEITVDIIIIQYSRKMQDTIDYFRDYSFSIMGYLDSDYQKKLLTAREHFSKEIYGVNKVSAICLHNGVMYRVLDKGLVHDCFLSNKADLLILSPVYGVVHAFEKIRVYRVVNEARYIRAWIHIGIDKIVSNYIGNRRPRRIYGFFPATSPYIEVFKSIVKRLRHTMSYLVTVDVCRGGYGFMVSRALGNAINHLLRRGYIPSSIDECILARESIVKNSST